jgi:hypothetical protein
MNFGKIKSFLHETFHETGKPEKEVIETNIGRIPIQDHLYFSETGRSQNFVNFFHRVDSVIFVKSVVFLSMVKLPRKEVVEVVRK